MPAGDISELKGGKKLACLRLSVLGTTTTLRRQGRVSWVLMVVVVSPFPFCKGEVVIFFAWCLLDTGTGRLWRTIFHLFPRFFNLRVATNGSSSDGAPEAEGPDHHCTILAPQPRSPLSIVQTDRVPLPWPIDN
jgi:hypothetical protein